MDRLGEVPAVRRGLVLPVATWVEVEALRPCGGFRIEGARPPEPVEAAVLKARDVCDGFGFATIRCLLCVDRCGVRAIAGLRVGKPDLFDRRAPLFAALAPRKGEEVTFARSVLLFVDDGRLIFPAFTRCRFTSLLDLPAILKRPGLVAAGIGGLTALVLFFTAAGSSCLAALLLAYRLRPAEEVTREPFIVRGGATLAPEPARLCWAAASRRAVVSSPS